MSLSMDIPQPAPAADSEPTPRRGVQLPPIQTTFTEKSQRLQRPRPVQTVLIEKDSIPLVENAGLGRRSSKLLRLFGRNKSFKNARLEATSKIVEEGENKVTLDDTKNVEQKTKKGADAGPVVEEPFPAEDISIVPGAQQPLGKPVRQRSARGTTKSKSFKKEVTTWDPPPLFQAYPQAIKHSTLSAPSMSADAILRHSQTKKSRRTDPAQTSFDVDVCDGDNQESGKKGRNAKKRQRSHEAVLHGPWLQKIYILVTSGYILQYAGDGSFDRLPEKIMLLGKDSAAFASDVIPGRPWVLRVCQEALEVDNAPVSQGPNSVLKKMSFRNESRRSVSDFLLVIDGAEEMSEWLVAVRKEIEALGGKQYRPDVAIRRTSSEIRRALREKPSRRFLIIKDPNRFADRAGDALSGVPNPSDAVPLMTARKDFDRRPSVATQKSIDSPSVCNTTLSTDQGNLEGLRETPRMSYASNAKTMSTSPASSSSHSPTHATFHAVGNGSSEPCPDYFVAPKMRRTSTYLLSSSPMTQRQSSDTNTSRPGSNSSRAGSSEATSPPHFSIPSYSKRYSVANNRLSRIAPPPSVRSSTIEETDIPVDEADGNDNCRSFLGELMPTPRTSPKGSKSLGNLSAHFNPPPPQSITFAPETSPGDIISSKAHAAVPRRFSSLNYSRGISPIRAVSNEIPSPSPHPPPTAALPAIPGTGSKLLPPSSYRHSIQPSANLSRQEQNNRRPISMQVRARPTVRVDKETLDIVSTRFCPADLTSISSVSSVISESTSPEPTLTTATMPAPPTRSAPPPPQLPQIQVAKDLPRLPSIRVSEEDFRASLEGPWSVEYSNERLDGLEAN